MNMLKIKHSSRATFGIQTKVKESKSNQIIAGMAEKNSSKLTER